MAVARPVLELTEVREILALIGRQPRGSSLYRARRELARCLERGEESEREDRKRMAEIRSLRRIPGVDETPLIPQSMSRFSR